MSKVSRVTVILIVASFAAALAHRAECATNEMALQDCIRYATEHSPALQKLAIAHHTKQLSTLIEKAAFDIGLSVRAASSDSGDDSGDELPASISLSKEIVGGINVTAAASFDDLSGEDTTGETYSITVSKVLLGGGSVRASRLGIDNAIIGETIALNTRNRAQRQLVFDLKKAYYELIRNTQTLRVRKMKLERAKKNLAHAIEREKPLDIATARLEVPQNKASVLRAELTILAASDRLRELMGMDMTNELTVDQKFVFEEQARNASNDLAHCLAHDETIVNALLERKQAENSAFAARREILPKITLAGAMIEAPGAEEETDQVISLALSWDIGSRAERAKHQTADNTISSKKLEVRILQLAREKETRNLGRRLDESAELVRLQVEKVKLGEGRAEIYADRWENGEIDILEYIRSQNDLENSRIELIRLKTTYMELVGAYQFTTGRQEDKKES
jgi:outer membrane protein TolC